MAGLHHMHRLCAQIEVTGKNKVHSFYRSELQARTILLVLEQALQLWPHGKGALCP